MKKSYLDNDNNEPIMYERFKALLEELRTIDRVSDYTAGFVKETEITTLESKIFKIGIEEEGLSGRFVCDMINKLLKEQLEK